MCVLKFLKHKRHFAKVERLLHSVRNNLERNNMTYCQKMIYSHQIAYRLHLLILKYLHLLYFLIHKVRNKGIVKYLFRAFSNVKESKGDVNISTLAK